LEADTTSEKQTLLGKKIYTGSGGESLCPLPGKREKMGQDGGELSQALEPSEKLEVSARWFLSSRRRKLLLRGPFGENPQATMGGVNIRKARNNNRTPLGELTKA